MAKAGKTTFYVDQLDSPAGLYAQLTGFGLGALAKDLDIVDESSSFAGSSGSASHGPSTNVLIKGIF